MSIPQHLHTHNPKQTWGPASRFASVPLADGQVWFATLPITFDQDAQDAQLQRQRRLLDHFGGWHAPIPALLAATPPGSILFDHAVAHRSFPPFNSSHSNDSGGGASSDWPVTVVGDAAHGVDPILAQGAGVAVEDAYALACALGGVGKGGEGDVAAALRCVVWFVVGGVGGVGGLGFFVFHINIWTAHSLRCVRIYT